RVEVGSGIYLGVDGRYRHDLGSTDPNRAERGRSESETLAGATAAYAHGSWALMLEAGRSRVRPTPAPAGTGALAGYTARFWFGVLERKELSCEQQSFRHRCFLAG